MKYLESSAVVERLKDEYLHFGKLLIAYDFDDTIHAASVNGWMATDGEVIEEVKKLLLRARPYCKYCVFTCRHGDELIAKTTAWLDAHGVPYDYINEDFPEFVVGSRKPFYNLLLDDRAGLDSSMDALWTFVDWAGCIRHR